MKKKFPAGIFALSIVFLVCGCKAFKYGYTSDKAQDNYNLVTGNRKNFGDKRLDYNLALHRNSALSNFLDCHCNNRGLPDFIYEYRTVSKCDGIWLYYVQRDSVFSFEEPAKRKLQSVLKEARTMNDDERQIFKRLKAGD